MEMKVKHVEFAERKQLDVAKIEIGLVHTCIQNIDNIRVSIEINIEVISSTFEDAFRGYIFVEF